MKKSNNKTLISIFVITIILAVIFWPKGKPIASGLFGGDKPTEPGSGGGSGGSSSGGGGTPAIKGIFPIKKGDKNEYVLNIQKAINFNYKYFRQNKSIVEDGSFGSKTIAALATLFNNAETITEGRYKFIMDRFKNNVPIGRRYVAPGQWPLQLGDIAGTGDARIRNLNVGLGVYTYQQASYNPASNEFSSKTLAALKLKKQGIDRVEEYVYKSMSEQFLFAPTILIN